MGQRADDLRRRDPLDEPSREGDIIKPAESERIVVSPGAEATEGEWVRTREVRAEGDVERREGEEASADVEEAPPEVEEIRSEIEQTRAEMSETIDAIQERLSPRRLVQEAQETVREQTVGRVEQMVSGAGDKAEEVVENVGESVGGLRSTIVDTIRQNPVPAALAGISLGWLFMNRPQGAQGGSGAHSGYRAGGTYYPRSRTTRRTTGLYGGRGTTYRGSEGGYTYEGAPTVYQRGQVGYEGEYGARARGGEEERGGVGQVTGKVGDVAGQAQQRAGEMASRAGEVASDVTSRAGELAEDVREGASDVVETAGERARDVGSTIVETIRRNPVPAALTAVGLGWLFMAGGGEEEEERRRYGRYAYGGYDYDYGYRYGAGPEYGVGRAGYEYGGEAGREEGQGGVGEVVGRVGGTVGETASQAQERAGELVDQARSQVQELGSVARSQVEDLGSEAQYRVRRARGQLEGMVEENPLAAGAVALAIGAAVGLAVPGTPKEDELMGETRERVMQQAQSTVRETADKVERVVQEAQSAGQRESRRQGLTE